MKSEIEITVNGVTVRRRSSGLISICIRDEITNEMRTMDIRPEQSVSLVAALETISVLSSVKH